MDKVTNDLDFGGLTREARKKELIERCKALSALLINAEIDLANLIGAKIKLLKIVDIQKGDAALYGVDVDVNMITFESADGEQQVVAMMNSDGAEIGDLVMPAMINTFQKAKGVSANGA
jgi:hypothetical protein